jgi:glycine/D-amino acid oxidase-like deaminating enzyme
MREEARSTIGVIGGGLQGVGLAIELSMRGFHVELFEKRDQCLSQASANNEGKVHLGFVYANDGSLETARLMSRGAFRFAPVLERWLESKINLKTSLPFHYVVHRDSQVSPDVLEGIYAQITAINQESGQVEGNHYLGQRLLPPMRRLSDGEWQGLAEPSLVSAVFQSSEAAVDPAPLNQDLRARLADDPRIRVITGTRVTSVACSGDEVQLSTESNGYRNTRRFGQVINAAWEDLIYLDDTAGVRPRGKWNFRVKHYLRGRIDGAAPQRLSATIVLGPFGDVVQFDDGTVFLSWYPVGRRRWSEELRLDEEAMSLAAGERQDVTQGIWDGLARLFPTSLGRRDPAAASLELKGGVILALGTTDVDDDNSQLHQRSRIGPRSFGRYHSVDTGKWTMAPLFAETLAARIADDYS